MGFPAEKFVPPGIDRSKLRLIQGGKSQEAFVPPGVDRDKLQRIQEGKAAIELPKPQASVQGEIVDIGALLRETGEKPKSMEEMKQEADELVEKIKKTLKSLASTERRKGELTTEWANVADPQNIGVRPPDAASEVQMQKYLIQLKDRLHTILQRESILRGSDVPIELSEEDLKEALETPEAETIRRMERDQDKIRTLRQTPQQNPIVAQQAKDFGDLVPEYAAMEELPETEAEGDYEGIPTVKLFEELQEEADKKRAA